jgi:hypothetical protein
VRRKPLMKKLIIMLTIFAVLAALNACDSPSATDEGWVQRPEFVDVRPDSMKLEFTKKGNRKKPVKPDPTPDPDPEPGDDPNPNPANKYAYIVGISDYEGTSNDLNYCDDDARDWISYLQGEGFTIQSDLDRQATADNIQAGLEWLMNSAQPGDEILFAYSGHGDDPREYGSCLISTDLWYLTNGWVSQYLEAANCTKKMIVVDACFAGDFQNVAGPNSLRVTASDNTYSYDGLGGMENGVWTYYFMEAVNTLGMVYGEDAADYANAEMKKWGRTYRARVSPGYVDMYTGMFDM